MHIEKGKLDDYKDVLRIANEIFYKDMEKIHPKLYSKNKANLMKNHFLIKELGEIKAIILCLPLQLQIANQTLNVCGIGTVAVHPESRSKGYMSKLMNEAVKESVMFEYDMMVLGGQRQRYEYFNFATCGTEIISVVNQSNLHHSSKKRIEGISIIPFNNMFLDECLALHHNQIVTTLRCERDFVLISKTWQSELFVVLKDDIFQGYIIASHDKKQVRELILKDENMCGAVALEWILLFQTVESEIHLMPYQIQSMESISKVSEKFKLVTDLNFRVLNYAKVLQAYMRLKHHFSPLMNGKFILEIKDKGKYAIIVSKEGVRVEESLEPCDKFFDELEAMYFLFSPVRYITQKNEISIIQNWFPIPLFFPHIDNV